MSQSGSRAGVVLEVLPDHDTEDMENVFVERS